MKKYIIYIFLAMTCVGSIATAMSSNEVFAYEADTHTQPSRQEAKASNTNATALADSVKVKKTNAPTEEHIEQFGMDL